MANCLVGFFASDLLSAVNFCPESPPNNIAPHILDTIHEKLLEVLLCQNIVKSLRLVLLDILLKRVIGNTHDLNLVIVVGLKNLDITARLCFDCVLVDA
jgi:hypothetical protein